jgi:hypothetical protein
VNALTRGTKLCITSRVMSAFLKQISPEDDVTKVEMFKVQYRWGQGVAQLVEALRYKSEGRGFDSRWCHWNFSLT